MHLLSTEPGINLRAEEIRNATAKIEYLANENGRQISHMDEATCTDMAEAHDKAATHSLLAPEERHLHSHMAHVYRQAAKAYRQLHR